jgi:hypothetical protein
MRVWDDTLDGGGKQFPAHLDLILDPRNDEWWGGEYGLAYPPETYHRARAYRDARRGLSKWQVRVKLYRDDPTPPNPDRPVRPWRMTKD